MRLLKDTFWSAVPSRIQSLVLVTAIIVLALVPSMTRHSPYTLTYLSYILWYCVMAASWSFFSGKTGYISLATAAFYGIGMYTNAIFGAALPLWVCIILAAILAFVVGLIIGVVTLRLRGIYFTIFTFGLALFFNKFMHWYEGEFTGTKGRMVRPTDNEIVYYILLIIIVITLVTILILNKSKFGLSLKCIGQNEDSAQHLGVNTTLTKVLAFALTVAPVGAVGVAMSSTMGYVDPDIAFGLNQSFFPVLMAIFGGLTSTYGPMIGALIFYALQDYLLRATSGYMIIFGAVMVVVILLMPNGIIGTVQSIITKSRKRKTEEAVTDA